MSKPFAELLRSKWSLPVGPLAVVCLVAIALAALLLAPVQVATSGATRTKCRDNLKRIGLAMHMYHQTYGVFPPPCLTDENGMPIHSWRVLLLPFLDEQELYDEYRFDEPWDGPSNSRLHSRMPEIFRCNRATDDA